MKVRNVTEAKAELSALLALVEQGEEIIIARAGRPIAVLRPYEARGAATLIGSMRGEVRVADDFDAPEETIRALFEEGA